MILHFIILRRMFGFRGNEEIESEENYIMILLLFMRIYRAI